MVAYIDRAGLEQRFGVDEIADLLDDNRNADSAEPAETASLEAAVNDASTLIDGYLATRYTLPLASVPPIVVGWAADIARFRLFDKQAPEEVRQRYDDAIGQLKDLARGLMSLPPGSEGEQVATAATFDGFSAERVFTMDSLRGF